MPRARRPTRAEYQHLFDENDGLRGRIVELNDELGKYKEFGNLTAEWLAELLREKEGRKE
jgi:hypothetical protein